MGLSESRRELADLLVERAVALRTDEEWADVEDYAYRWFADLKVAESADTFEDAFGDNRMTLRCILEERHIGHYTPTHVALREGEMWKNTEGTIKTMQGIPGMQARMTADNFFGVGARDREKYRQGLFDVSAVLLDGHRSLEIGADANQMYRTSGNTTYIFMPVPKQQDMIAYFMLNSLARAPGNQSLGLKTFAAYMKSRLTRIKLAFEGDAGAIFVLKLAPDGEIQPKIKYGFGKLLKRTASPEEVRRRRIQALTYKTVLNGANRNEIIVSYRQHGLLARQPSTFPLYAKGVFVKSNDPNKPTHNGFVVIGADMQPTGKIINLQGQMGDGNERSFGPGASVANHSPPKTSGSK